MNHYYYFYPIIAYLLGSIPFGLILSNIFGNGQLRESGSKNIGATNVLRTQGKLLGLCTLLLDFSKAFVPCYFFANTNSEFANTGSEIINLLVLAAPAIGHMFPIWLKFRGGKGVATYFGILGALDIYVFFGTVLAWVIIFAISRISSVACLSSILFSCGLFPYVMKNIRHLEFFNQLCVLILLAVIIFVKHHENIKRLISNKEMKI